MAATRWDLWLPLAAAVVAALLVTLGITAARALRESRDLALEGLVMRQAHEVERELRESGPEAAPEVLERSLRISVRTLYNRLREYGIH